MATYKELDSIKATIIVERYHRLSQTLLDYKAEWEILNQQHKMACQRQAICLHRNDDMSKCDDVYRQWLQAQQLANDFFVRVRQVSIAPQADVVRTTTQ